MFGYIYDAVHADALQKHICSRSIYRPCDSVRALDDFLERREATGWIHVIGASSERLPQALIRRQRYPAKHLIIVGTASHEDLLPGSLVTARADAKEIVWLRSLEDVLAAVRKIYSFTPPHSISCLLATHAAKQGLGEDLFVQELLTRCFLDLDTATNLKVFTANISSRARMLQRHVSARYGLKPPKHLLRAATAFKGWYALACWGLTVAATAEYCGVNEKTLRRHLREVLRVAVPEARQLCADDAMNRVIRYIELDSSAIRRSMHGILGGSRMELSLLAANRPRREHPLSA